MRIPAEKAQEKQYRAAAHREKASGHSPGPAHVETQLASNAQRRHQASHLDDGSVASIHPMQRPADNSPQVQRVAQLQAMADGYASGQKQPYQRKPNQTGLPDSLKTGIENMSGYAMDDVKVHFNSAKPAQLQAHAYAQGSNIHVAPGQEKHLPHEAWHVVQQKQGRVRPTLQMKGQVNINDNVGLEREADVMGAIAAKGGSGEREESLLTVAGAQADTIQGKFGFEFELTIAVEAAVKDKSKAGIGGVKYKDPKRTSGIDIVLGTGDKLELHVDHQEAKPMVGSGVVDDEMFDSGEGAPIIEIVTYPLNEFAPNIDQQVQDLIDELDTIQAGLAAARGNRTPLNTILPGADARLVVGGAKAGRQNTDSYTHATYGIKLSNVTETFSRHAQLLKVRRGGNSARAANLEKAVSAAEAISDWMFGKYKDRTKRHFLWTDLNRYDIHDQEDMNKIKGLLTLLGNYMIAYTMADGKLMKNQVGVFFYKSKLNELVAHLSAKQKKLLTDRSGKIAEKLLAECVGEREAELDKSIDWKTWVVEVLQGQNDSILEEAKNAYSPKLGPDQLGPAGHREAGVVMENRYIAEFLRNFGRKLPPNEWGPMITTVKNFLAQSNGLDDAAGGD